MLICVNFIRYFDILLITLTVTLSFNSISYKLNAGDNKLSKTVPSNQNGVRLSSLTAAVNIGALYVRIVTNLLNFYDIL